MKHAKKSASAVLVILLSVSIILSGCGTPVAEKSTPTTDSGQLQPYEITFAYMNPGPPQKDQPLVEEAINKITQAKINATVKLMPLQPSQVDQIPLNLQGGQKIDVMMTGLANRYFSLVSQGLLAPMDSLLDKYGKGITKAYADNGFADFLEVGSINGKRYSIPTIRSFAGAQGIEFSKEMADKYNIDFSKVKTWDDLDLIFKTIKDKAPGVTPLQMGAASAMAIGYLPESQFDNLGDNLGVLMLNGDNSTNQLKVVNLYETSMYADILKTVRRWWEAGYINQDASTPKNILNVQVLGSGNAFATIPPPVIIPGFAATDSLMAGKPMEVVQLSEPKAQTATVADMMLSIPYSSKDQSRAMMFLNLLYTDPQLVNLLDWGIEGKNYVKKSETSIDYPEGVTQRTNGYAMPFANQMGNQFLSYTLTSQGSDYWKTLKDWNMSAVKSPALGFMFNPDPVKSQYASVLNVISQYGPQLQTGSVDPDKVLPVFIAKLKASGIDQVVAEKQKQLDAWVQSKK